MPAGGGSCECGLQGEWIPIKEISKLESFDRGLYIQSRWSEFIKLNIKEFLSVLSKAYDLREVTVFINNMCNLKCRHCYIAYTAARPYSEEKWFNILEKILNADVNQLGIVGTEPLLTPDLLIKTLERCNEYRQEKPAFRFGLISNLTTLTEGIAERLGGIRPSFFNISLDGIEAVHDQVRGNGNFSKTFNNLFLLKKYFDLHDKIFLLTTWSTLTCPDYPEFIMRMSEKGFSQYVVSPYIASMTGDPLSLNIAKLLNTIEKVYETIEQRNLKDLTVCLKLDYMSLRAIHALIKEGMVVEDEFVTDDTRRLFYVKNFPHNSKFIYLLYPIPENYWKAVRIGPDGRLSGCSEMFSPDYVNRSIPLEKYVDLKSACLHALNSRIGESFFSEYLRRQKNITCASYENISVDDIIMSEAVNF